MARVVLIEKVSAVTKITTWDDATPTVKTIKSYPNGADLKYDPDEDRLYIYPKSPSLHLPLEVVFSELYNVYAQADLEEFSNYVMDNDFFSSASGGSGALITATGDGTTTIDWGVGQFANFQFGAFDEVFTFTPPTKAGIVLLKLTQDSVGSRTVTFPASVKWTEGIAPTLTTTATTGTDIITLYFDGTDYYSVEALNFS
tara:strand:- start:1653 stop:2252 length:600 start_codon:yes stop_codon:yes gene_type:complete